MYHKSCYISYMKKIKSFEDILELLPDKQKHMIETLKQVRERPDFHPEESAYEHVRLVTEKCIKTGDIDLILAAVFHDIFKFKSNTINEKTGYPTAPDHDKDAALMVLDNSDFIKSLGGDPLIVSGICFFHMRIKNFKIMKKSKKQKMINQPFFMKTLVFALADDMFYSGPMPKLKGLVQNKLELVDDELIFNKKRLVCKFLNF